MKEIRIRIPPFPQEPTFREFCQHPERYLEEWRKFHRVLQELFPQESPLQEFLQYAERFLEEWRKFYGALQELLQPLRAVSEAFRPGTVLSDMARGISEAFRPGTVLGDIGLIVSGEDRKEAPLRLARRLPWTSPRIRKALARRVEAWRKRGEEASLEDEEVRERAAALLLVLTMDEKEMKRLRIPDEMTWSEFLRWAVLKEMERSVVERSEAGDHEVDLEVIPDPVEEEAERRPEATEIWRRLEERLTPRQREILHALLDQMFSEGRRYRGWNLAEIARKLGLKESTARVVMKEIRRKARAMMEAGESARR